MSLALVRLGGVEARGLHGAYDFAPVLRVPGFEREGHVGVVPRDG